MFGLEILDVVIGLTFVYLLLALLASALNEYISAVLNLRGRELARGLGRLLDELDEKGAVEKALDGVGRKLTTSAASLTEQLYNHRLIRPYATRRGRFGRFLLWIRRKEEKPRLPSYIPARTFALALLDVLGIRDEADVERLRWQLDAGSPPSSPPAGAEGTGLLHVLSVLQRDAPRDVTEWLPGLDTVLETPDVGPNVKLRLLDALTGAQTRLERLHDSVEVWFNNSMDRVSGAYKRNVQGWLFAIGLGIAVAMNADTIQMWRTLATNDKLRDAMAERAGQMLAVLEPEVDRRRAQNTGSAGSPPTDTTAQQGTGAEQPGRTGGGGAQADSVRVTLPAPGAGDTAQAGTAADAARREAARRDSLRQDSVRQDSVAWARFERIKTPLDSMELQLGWTTAEAVRVRVLRTDTTETGTHPTDRIWFLDWLSPLEKSLAPAGYHADLFPFDTRPIWPKLLGLLLTALAISLGAPFWFDLLNKVVSIRATGRSPSESPKSPEGGPKRAAEQAPR